MEEADKSKRPPTSKARLVAEQAREDDQDKAEITRLMVSSWKEVTLCQKLLEENNKNMEENMKEI